MSRVGGTMGNYMFWSSTVRTCQYQVVATGVFEGCRRGLVVVGIRPSLGMRVDREDWNRWTWGYQRCWIVSRQFRKEACMDSETIQIRHALSLFCFSSTCLLACFHFSFILSHRR